MSIDLTLEHLDQPVEPFIFNHTLTDHAHFSTLHVYIFQHFVHALQVHVVADMLTQPVAVRTHLCTRHIVLLKVGMEGGHSTITCACFIKLTEENLELVCVSFLQKRAQMLVYSAPELSITVNLDQIFTPSSICQAHRSSAFGEPMTANHALR